MNTYFSFFMRKFKYEEMEKMDCISYEDGKYELEYVGDKMDVFIE